MKWNYKLYLATIASVAVLLPMAAFAEDQNQNQDQKKKVKQAAASQQHGGKAAQQGTAQVSTPSGLTPGRHVHNEGKVNNAASGQGHVSHVVNGPPTVQRSNVSAVTKQNVQSSNGVMHSQRNQSNVSTARTQGVQTSNQVVRSQRSQSQVYSGNQPQVFSNQQQYTRGNNYGGLWFAESTHGDWSRDGEHYWNHHHYRWYQGGWLIIDGGYNPYYTNTSYSNWRSTVSNVQISLANQGYYRGPIDGDIGPGTRNAIAGYQSYHDLRVTGRINDTLLQSLRLE